MFGKAEMGERIANEGQEGTDFDVEIEPGELGEGWTGDDHRQLTRTPLAHGCYSRHQMAGWS